MLGADYCLGPLTRIRVLGTICPCLLSEEDALAKSSYNSLSRLLSKKIIYHKPPPPSTVAESSSKSFLQSFTAGLLGGGNTSSDDTSGSSSEKWEKIESQIYIVNGFRNTIAMEIIPCDGKTALEDSVEEDEEDDDDDDDDSETRALSKSHSNHNKIIVPFQKIGIVSAGSAQLWSGSCSSSLVHVYGKQSQHNPSGKGDEILRFSIMEGVDRVQFIDFLMNLVHWDRSRKKFGEEEEEDDTNTIEMSSSGTNKSNNKHETKKGFLKTKADKAAHFAKRELEMQQRKREREQRKAKYLKDTGGLKYTAIAMANMN